MTEPPPNKMSQSPERGRHACLRSHAATKGRLGSPICLPPLVPDAAASAGTAAMLTHGVATQRRATIGIAAYVPAIRASRPSTPHAAGQPSYSPAVKDPHTFSGANQALQRTAPCVTAPASTAAFPPTVQVPRRALRSLSLGS